MKTTLLFLSVFLSANLLGQLEVTENKSVPTQKIVLQIDSSTVETNYMKCKTWIQNTFSNPDEVIVSDIVNSSIKIIGVSASTIFVKGYNSKLKFSILFKFKDDKVKFEVVSLSYHISTSMSWTSFDMTYAARYKSNGKEKKIVTASQESVLTYLNDLYAGFNKIMVAEDTDDDW